MTQADDFLAGSDSIRSAQPLKHLQTVTFNEPLPLECGGELPSVTIGYETYGQLDADAANAVLLCHALSGDSHVAAHDEQDVPGWWDLAGMVGPGCPIDTDRYFVICPNVLGGCSGSTGPNSLNPATGEPYGPDFPQITVSDMVAAQHRLVRHLGITRLLAVVGGSMGGHQVLCWAKNHPADVRGVVPIATGPRLSAQSLAFDVVGRNAILRDPAFRGGHYYAHGPRPNTGLAIARMIGHITYLSPEAMKAKFDADRLRPRDVTTEFEKTFSVGTYLGYKGDQFVERFDANSYITLTMAMDLFDLGADREALARTLDLSLCRWLVISYTGDWLFPPRQSRELVDALLTTNKPVSYCNIESTCGHDAFLLPDNVGTYGELTRAFLANLHNGEVRHPDPSEVAACSVDPTSIYHENRVDYDRILELIPPEASVLDVGCGAGGLLWRLKQRGHRRIMGVDVDEQAVLTCVRRGLDAVQIDAASRLGSFDDTQFDCVVLSQTLQAVLDVQGVIDDVLRVGRWGIVSFPNFGYHKLRTMLAEEGKAPVSPGQLRHHWYDTPNLRFLSIRDFQDYCQQNGIAVHRLVAMDTETNTEVHDDPNLNADLAVFLLSRETD